jgi:hypothetical protein
VKPSKYEVSRLAMRILYIGLFIDVVGAAVLFFGGMFLESKGLTGSVPMQELKIFGYALLAVSILELVVIFVLKKKWLTPNNPMFAETRFFKQLSGRIQILYIILYFLALSPVIYGFLFFMMGGVRDMFVLMACITLIGYLLVRPRPAFIEGLLEPFDFNDL